MLGINSIYKLWYQGEVFLANDIKTLLKYTKNMRYKMSFNELTLGRIIKFGYNTNWDTCFNNITRIPDNFLLIEGTSSFGTFKEAIENSISNCLMKTEKDNFGILFSGGIDSTILLYHLKNDDIPIFHLLRGVDDAYAYDTLKEWKLDFNLNVMDTLLENDLKVTNEMLLANETTIDMGSLAYNCRIFKWIRDTFPKIKYLFTGDGADELFAKYPRNQYYDSRLTDVFDELVFYHIPRLEKTAKYYGLELLCPYLDENIAVKALQLPHDKAIFGKVLKDEYKGLIPIEIIERPKIALKKDLFDDPKLTRDERINLYGKFKYIFNEEYNVS